MSTFFSIPFRERDNNERIQIYQPKNTLQSMNNQVKLIRSIQKKCNVQSSFLEMGLPTFDFIVGNPELSV